MPSVTFTIPAASFGSTGPSLNGPGQTYYGAASSGGTPSGFNGGAISPDPTFVDSVQLTAFGQISTSPVDIAPNGLGFIVILAQAGLPQDFFTNVTFTLGDGNPYDLATADATLNSPWDDTGTGYTTWIWSSPEPFFPPATFPDVITINWGAAGSAVPDVVGDQLPTAESVLTTAGFTIGAVTTADNAAPAGTVISQTPVGGTIEPPGTPISLVVSTGPAMFISKLTKKLLLSLHRPFDKDPHPQLAFRIQYDGTGLTWSILNGILTLTATGGTGTSHTFNIANFKIGQLAQFIAALPGYSVPYQDTSAYALLSALALLDSSGSINVSNGDHVFGYTTILWAWMDANSSELGTAKAQIDNALLQMNTISAEDEWLDYHGTFYNVPRQQGELDPGYSPRMIASVLQPRGNNIAIAEAIKSITQAGQGVFVIDAINDTSFAITYNGLIHFDGAEFYDAGLGVNGAYGFFDVDFSFDFAGPVTQATYYAQILTTVEDFRDGGTQLRAVIFRNNGSTTTVISDTFVGRIRVIVYDDFTGATYRLLEDGSTRFNEDGSARILET